MAKLLLESMESEWDPSGITTPTARRWKQLVEAKRQGDEIVVGDDRAGRPPMSPTSWRC